MTPERFQECLTAIGWSKRRVADRLGVTELRIRRWAAGVYPVPEAVAQWLECLAAVHHDNPPPTTI